MNIRHTLFVAAATAGFATTVGATAAMATTAVDAATNPPTQTRSVIVRYHASDLNSSAGADRLLERVSGAAWRVCTNADWADFEFDRRGYRQCRSDAIARAVSQIDRPKLTAAYDRHFGGGNLHPAAAVAPQQAHATQSFAG
jgi:UrcA family protein